MKIINNTKLNPIVSFTAENFISNEALINMGTTSSMCVNLYNQYYKTNEEINTDEILNIFNVENIPHTLEGLNNKLREIRELDISYPIDYIDTYLTDIINIYLKQIFNVDVDIDSAFLDFEELVEYLESNPKFTDCISKLVYKVMNTLDLNHNYIKTIVNAINDNKVAVGNETLYILPIFYCENIVFIKAGLDLDMKQYQELIGQFDSIVTKRFEVTKNNKIYDFLVELENVSELFSKIGYTRCCYWSITNMKGYESFIVYKNIDGSYIVQF